MSPHSKYCFLADGSMSEANLTEESLQLKHCTNEFSIGWGQLSGYSILPVNVSLHAPGVTGPTVEAVTIWKRG